MNLLGEFDSSRKHRAFALAEVVVVLLVVSLGVALVLGLGQQVMQLRSSSRQTAAVIELRAKSNAMTRNVDSWLARMRSDADTMGIFASCIPDPTAVSSIYSCPSTNVDILSHDSELQRIAGTQLHAASVPIVDIMGDLIAGTEGSPLYLDLDGRACSGSNCTFKSIGYMLRSNSDTDANPGSVRFVVKLAPQARNIASGAPPLRTQYFTMDLGMEWAQPGGFCPSGSIKVGYLSSGKPNCINPTKKCTAGTIHLGLDDSGNPICKAPPVGCTGSGNGVVINAAGDDLICAASTPCDTNQIFLGYYSGTGLAMCSSTNLQCPDNEVQVGIAQNGGSLQASCKQLPSCNDSQKLSYDGSNFVCASASIASTCLAGQFVVGINQDGSAKCEVAQRNLTSTNLSCNSGEYVSGLFPDGTVICAPFPNNSAGGSSSSSASAFPTGFVLQETRRILGGSTEALDVSTAGLLLFNGSYNHSDAGAANAIISKNTAGEWAYSITTATGCHGAGTLNTNFQCTSCSGDPDLCIRKNGNSIEIKAGSLISGYISKL